MINKKAESEIWGRIGVIATILFMIIIVANCIYEYSNLNNAEKSYPDKCQDECQKFNYTFYKIDNIPTYGATNHFCYCIDKKGEPINLGTIDG